MRKDVLLLLVHNLNAFVIVVGIFLNVGRPLIAWLPNMQHTSDRLVRDTTGDLSVADKISTCSLCV